MSLRSSSLPIIRPSRISGSIGDSSGQLLDAGSTGDSRGGSGGAVGLVVGATGRAKFLGGDLRCLGISARMPGLSCCLALERVDFSRPRLYTSLLNGEKASTLLAALVTGLAPRLLVLLFSIERVDEADEESEPEGRWWLLERLSCCTGLGTGGASCILWSIRDVPTRLVLRLG